MSCEVLPPHCVFEVTRYRKGWLWTEGFQPPIVYVDVLLATVEFGDQASKEDTELTRGPRAEALN